MFLEILVQHASDLLGSFYWIVSIPLSCRRPCLWLGGFCSVGSSEVLVRIELPISSISKEISSGLDDASDFLKITLSSHREGRSIGNVAHDGIRA